MAGGAAFPLAKLGFLVIKQISKPIAQGFARRAKQSRIFREYICIPIAQFYHWYDVKVSLSKFKDRVPFCMFCFYFIFFKQFRMRVLKLGNATTIPKLNEERAIETGSQLLSELIILGIASGMLMYEYQRSAEKEEAKKEQIERDKAYLNDKLERLGSFLDKQKEDLEELKAISKRLQDEVDQRKSSTKGGLKSLASKIRGNMSLPEKSDTEVKDVVFNHEDTTKAMHSDAVILVKSPSGCETDDDIYTIPSNSRPISMHNVAVVPG